MDNPALSYSLDDIEQRLNRYNSNQNEVAHSENFNYFNDNFEGASNIKPSSSKFEIFPGRIHVKESQRNSTAVCESNTKNKPYHKKILPSHDQSSDLARLKSTSDKKASDKIHVSHYVYFTNKYEETIFVNGRESQISDSCLPSFRNGCSSNNEDSECITSSANMRHKNSKQVLFKKKVKQDFNFSESIEFVNGTNSERKCSEMPQVKIQRKNKKSDTKLEYKVFESEVIKQNSVKPKSSRTLTMLDARKIASCLNKHPFETICSATEVRSNLQDSFPILAQHNKCIRRCWAKSCWSVTNHSHVFNNDVSKIFPKNNRAALLKTVAHPDPTKKSWTSKLFGKCSPCSGKRLNKFELWNGTLRKIEGQFGTGVVSYFVFLRWLILLNILMFLFYFILIIFPHITFVYLPHKDPNLAPKESLLNEEFLQQFPEIDSPKITSKRVMKYPNVSFDVDLGVLQNLDEYFDNFLPNEILDITLYYDKRNFTGYERRNISTFCREVYLAALRNRSSGFLNKMQDLLQGTGWLESTILFLGFYPPNELSYFGFNYNMPLAFLSVFFFSFILCLFMMLLYSSHGIRESLLVRKSSYLTYLSILFCSWDYCIDDIKHAALRHQSIVHEIKSNLAEDRRKLEIKQWSTQQKLKVCFLRVVVNILVVLCLLASFYVIYKVVDFQLEQQRLHRLNDSGIIILFIQFLSPLTITGLNIIMPIIFYTLVKFEMYSTQDQINKSLVRIVFLRLSSVIVLVFSLHRQITCEPKDFCRVGKNADCQSPICWETYVGQQIYKLAITDVFVYVFMFFGFDLPRDFIVVKCKNKVTQLIGRQVFDLPSQVLALVYSQTLCWLGAFYCPLLPFITVLKLIIVFYIKKCAVLKCCIPGPIAYKASRSNAMFMTTLFVSFFATAGIQGYSLSSIEPSPSCSPFRYYRTMISAIPDAIHDWSPKLISVLSFIFSGFFFIPAILLLCLPFYYYWTVIVAQKKMIKVLKAQIMLEGHDKQFLLNQLVEAAKQRFRE